MNTAEIKLEAHEILNRAFDDVHPIRRRAHLQMVNALVTFNDKMRRYEHVLAHPEQFERQPPQPVPAVVRDY